MRPVVLSAIFYESSTYDDQFSSAFETHFDRGVGDRLMSVTEGGININANTLSHAVGDAIKMQSRCSSQIFIPGGFGEKRLSFIITIEISGTPGYGQRQVLTGYTNYFGINFLRGSIDEEMELIINNSIILRDTPHHTARGTSNRIMVESNEYILRDSQSTHHNQRGKHFDRSIRPVDIFNAHGVGDIQRIMGGSTNYCDTRADLGGEIKMSSRQDNNPATYLSRTLKAGIASQLSSESDWNPESQFSDQPESKSNMAAGAVNVGSIENNPVFMAFLDECNFQQAGVITIQEMRDCLEWPETIHGQRVTRMITRQEREDRNYTSYSRGQGNSLNGADRESVAARIISRALPSILMSNHICDAQVDFTNDTIDSTMSVIVLEPRPLVPGEEISRYIPAVEELVRMQIANPVSKNGGLLVTARIDCSAITDVKIWISIEGGPEEFYCYPMHCDGLLSPQKTDDWDLASKISNDLNTTITDMVDNIYQRQDDHARQNGPRDVWDDGGVRDSGNRFD